MKMLFTSLAEKPHKLFFFGGMVQAMVTMMVLLLHVQDVSYTILALSSFHAYTLIFAVFSQFFFGFLCTMFPRFLAVPEIEAKEYQPPFLLLNGAALLFTVAAYGSGVLTLLATAGMAAAYLMVVRILGHCYRQSEVTERADVNWMVLALVAGGVSQLLFLISFANPEWISMRRMAVDSGFFLFLFMLIITVSQKMIPFFTEGKVTGYRANRSRYFLHSMAVLLLLKVLFSAASLNSFGLIDGGLLVITLRELIRWRLPIRQVPPMLWVLYLALFWIPLGFLLLLIEGISPLLSDTGGWMFEKGPLHLISIGFFTTLLMGFGSRIILGHAGEKPVADRYTIGLFWFLQGIVLVRLVAGMMVSSGGAILSGSPSRH